MTFSGATSYGPMVVTTFSSHRSPYSVRVPLTGAGPPEFTIYYSPGPSGIRGVNGGHGKFWTWVQSVLPSGRGATFGASSYQGLPITIVGRSYELGIMMLLTGSPSPDVLYTGVWGGSRLDVDPPGGVVEKLHYAKSIGDPLRVYRS